jgi:hypothetical protein
MEVSGQLRVPAALPPGKDSVVPIGEETGLQSRSRRGGEEKNSPPLPGHETPIIQTVAQRCITELSCCYLNT